MATRLRSVVVTIDVETNKTTRRETFAMQDEESASEFSERVAERITTLVDEEMS